MNQQDELIEPPRGDEGAGETGTAVRDDRFARLSFQPGDFRREVAARDGGRRPARSPGLQCRGLSGRHELPGRRRSAAGSARASLCPAAVFAPAPIDGVCREKTVLGICFIGGAN